MLIDSFGRIVDYLRISVTDRCNLRCTYCMPKEGVPLKSHYEMLRFEEIIHIVEVGASLGISKVRLTGGEPLLKRNIDQLVQQLSTIEGIDEVAMTTNGTLLTEEKAILLKKSGLTRVNISLDTLSSLKFSSITGSDKIEDVFRGIDAAIKAELTPIKINMVITDHTTPSDIEEMEQFCDSKGVSLQKIQNFSLLHTKSDISIEAERPPKCHSCNRLRLTADGYLKSCLFSNSEIRVTVHNVRDAFQKSVEQKSERGHQCNSRVMSQIGG